LRRVIPSVLKYLIEFISDDAERDIKTFLLTAAGTPSLTRCSLPVKRGKL
jgi:hypothetical protein